MTKNFLFLYRSLIDGASRFMKFFEIFFFTKNFFVIDLLNVVVYVCTAKKKKKKMSAHYVRLP